MRPPIVLITLSLACTTREVRVAHAPTAFAGFDSEAVLGEPIVLDGTRSLDPDGDRLGYGWKLEAQPLGSETAIVDLDRALASITPDELGVYVVSLTVADGDFIARDLVAIEAVAGSETSTASLGIALEPRACNADRESLADAECGFGDQRVAIEPTMLAYPRSIEGELEIQWTFFRLPLGVDASELSVDSPSGALGAMTFVPPRPGEYWIGARLIGPNTASSLAVATVGVFGDDPPADERPLPSIEARSNARAGEIILFDSRLSYVPTSSTGVRPRRNWTLVVDPSQGQDELTDVATGCMVDECRRLIPSVRGDYLVSLQIGSGVTALAALEVR